MHKNMKSKAKKVVSKAMRETTEEAFTELKNCPNIMLRLTKGPKIDSKEVKGRRCMTGSDGKMCFNVKERGKVRKDYRERIMNGGYDWDRNVERDAVEDQAACVSREKVV